MELNIYKDADELSMGVAKWLTGYITDTLKKKDRFTIALSGGSTPHKLHTLLAGPPFKDQIDWSKLHIFWGDERAVPFEDSRNNAKMAYDTLLNHVKVPASQIHIMRTDIEPEAAAAAYEKVLHHYFHAHETSFDLVFLGMGDDGHTLSLFPGTQVIHEENKLALAYYLEAQGMYRITLTAPIVNRSAAIAFLVAGSSKAPALKEVIEGDYNPDKYPSQIIKPASGEVYWFTDEAAAALLQ